MALVPTYAPTRYEVAVFHADGRKLVLGYTARRSQMGCDAFMGPIAAKRIRAFCELPEDLLWKWKAGAYRAKTTNWAIGFTGLTERDVKNAPQPKGAMANA